MNDLGKKIVIFLIILAVVVTITGSFMRMENSDVEASEFIVYQRGSTTYLRNGETEKVTSYSSENVALTQAIENTTPGGYIHVKDGHYDVAGLQVETGVTIVGSSMEATVFDSPSDEYAMVIDNQYSIGLRSFQINGQGFNIINNSESVHIRNIDIANCENGIRICNSQNVRVEEVSIDNFSTHAICMGNDPALETHSFRMDFHDIGINDPQPSVEQAVYINGQGQAIERCMMTAFAINLNHNAEDGMHVQDTGENGDINFEDWKVLHSADDGILVENAPNHVFRDVGTTGHIVGIKVENSDDTTIDTCGVAPGEHSPQIGIHVQASSNVSISDSNYSGAENRAVWLENNYHISLVNSTLYGSRYGVYVENTSGLISNNDVTDSSTKPIKRLDSNMEVQNNPGYVLLNDGTATMVNGNKSVTFPHGLDEIPDIVLNDPAEESSKNFYLSNKNIENITLSTGSTLNENVDISWRAVAH